MEMLLVGRDARFRSQKLSQIFTLCAETFPIQIKRSAEWFVLAALTRSNPKSVFFFANGRPSNWWLPVDVTLFARVNIPTITHNCNNFHRRRIFCVGLHMAQMARRQASGPWHIDFRLHFLVFDYPLFMIIHWNGQYSWAEEAVDSPR